MPTREWQIYGKKTSAYRQIGNAFPPPVAQAVAKKVDAELKEQRLLLERLVQATDELKNQNQKKSDNFLRYNIIRNLDRDSEAQVSFYNELYKEQTLTIHYIVGYFQQYKS